MKFRFSARSGGAGGADAAANGEAGTSAPDLAPSGHRRVWRDGPAGSGHRRIAAVTVVVALLATGLVIATRGIGSPHGEAKAGQVGQDRPLKEAVPSPSAAVAGDPGLRLLDEAVIACRSTSYQGVQLLAWWGPDGMSASLVQVWHQVGSDMAIATAATASASPDASQADLTAEGQDPEAILGVSPDLLGLLDANYRVSYGGTGAVDGRSAQVVDVRRTDGSLAARFWIDTATKLPLRREMFDARSRVFSEAAFIDLALGPPPADSAPSMTVQAAAKRLAPGQLDTLRSEGWPVPGPLPERLAMFQATETVGSSGKVINLAYSDGLSVVSVFVQRGHLPKVMSGWQATRIQGHLVYVTEPDNTGVSWSAGGFVYTVIANAPAATLDEVVATLPHEPPPTFWRRMAHGFHRLFAWADPFR